MSLANLRARYDEMVKSQQAELKAAFAEEMKDLFTKYPEMKTFAWHQYTPYFNDGEPCIFRVYTYYESVEINDKSYDNDDVEFPEWHEAAAKEGCKLLTAAGNDVLLAAFDDHTTVTAHRDGTFTTEGYDHD